MAKITNKDILQSYILTTAKYDFNVYEKRILYRIIEFNQFLLEGKKLSAEYRMDSNLYGDKTYTMPISLFLKDGEKNNQRIKDAFKKLESKKIEYTEPNGDWGYLALLGFPKFIESGSLVRFKLSLFEYQQTPSSCVSDNYILYL